MVLCYLLACIPLAVGAVLWGLNKRVVWFEWLLGAAAAFLVAGIFHLIAVNSMAGDQETWSGQITQTTFHPRWVEEYEVAIYKNVTKTRSVTRNGKTSTETYTDRVFSHYETRYRTHTEHWTTGDTLRGDGIAIDQGTSDRWAQLFGGRVSVHGHKSGFYSGDPNLYVAQNKTGYLIPTTQWRSFENRVRAAPSLFSYSKPPETAKLFAYPPNENWLVSDRLVGFARNAVDQNEFDKMNARLGPTKKVNVIMASFGPQTERMMAEYQEAAWVGGKKNDVVIVYGGGESVTKPTWCKVFGWTERIDCKHNLENLIMEAEKVDTSILPQIEKEIAANYIIKDWSKFDYITVEPPDWAYVVLIFAMLLTQGGYWVWAFQNGEDKCAYETAQLDHKINNRVADYKQKWADFKAYVGAKFKPK